MIGSRSRGAPRPAATPMANAPVTSACVSGSYQDEVDWQHEAEDWQSDAEAESALRDIQAAAAVTVPASASAAFAAPQVHVAAVASLPGPQGMPTGPCPWPGPVRGQALQPPARLPAVTLPGQHPWPAPVARHPVPVLMPPCLPQPLPLRPAHDLYVHGPWPASVRRGQRPPAPSPAQPPQAQQAGVSLGQCALPRPALALQQRSSPLALSQVDVDPGEAPLKRRRVRNKSAPPATCLNVHDAVLKDEDLEDMDLSHENAQTKKRVYLVTFPHTSRKDLVPPEPLTKAKLMEKFLDAMSSPIHANTGGATCAKPVQLEKAVVAQEPHKKLSKDGKIHNHCHIALLADESFRFLAVKRALLQRHNLASHWSCNHSGYHSAVRYLVMASPKKALEDLHAEPFLFCRDGQHPPVLDQASEPQTAAALRRRREHKAQVSAQEGKGDPRATELDLYYIIVEQGFRNTADNRHADKALIEHLKQFASPSIFQFAFRNRARLGVLIDNVWAWEKVSDTLAMVATTRVERLAQAQACSCVCGGLWPVAASRALSSNNIDADLFWYSVYMALHDGRREDKQVVTCVGRRGGEGKSFLFSPVPAVYGVDLVQKTPQKGNYPLMGLESKRVVVLDEWRFNEVVLSMATQLLWFEGKPILLAMPQNQGVCGHLLYKGSAPIFITTKEGYLKDLVDDASRAEAANAQSEATMLLRRLRLFHFQHKLVIDRNIEPCASCFSRLVLAHAAAHHAKMQV